MNDISRLLFRREHFPVTGKFHGYRDIVPPYHPSIAREGINFEIAVSSLDEALENAVLDLEEISSKGLGLEFELKSISRDPQTGKIQMGLIRVRDFGVTINPFPITGGLYIGRDFINPWGPGGDNYIAIRPGRSPVSFAVPSSVEFSEKLMREYEMRENVVALGYRNIECQNLWASHNALTLHHIFYKNLVIALDNAVVRRKYST